MRINVFFFRLSYFIKVLNIFFSIFKILFFYYVEIVSLISPAINVTCNVIIFAYAHEHTLNARLVQMRNIHSRPV